MILKSHTSITLTMAALMLTLFNHTSGIRYMVGDSTWSIPVYPEFYSDWSSSQFFKTNDSLYFEYEAELYNVMQVSTTEYEACTAEYPFKVFEAGSVDVLLSDEGVYNFICNVSNYCSLGQRISITVQNPAEPFSLPPPTPSQPSLSPVSPPKSSACEDRNMSASSPAASVEPDIGGVNGGSTAGGSGVVVHGLVSALCFLVGL